MASLFFNGGPDRPDADPLNLGPILGIFRDAGFLIGIIMIPIALALKILEVFLPPLLLLVVNMVIWVSIALGWLAKQAYRAICWLAPRVYRSACRFCRYCQIRVLKLVRRLRKRVEPEPDPSLT